MGREEEVDGAVWKRGWLVGGGEGSAEGSMVYVRGRHALTVTCVCPHLSFKRDRQTDRQRNRDMGEWVGGIEGR